MGPSFSSSSKISNRIFTVALSIALGSLLFGYDTGIIGGALLYIIPEFSLENKPGVQGLIVSSALFGALLGTAGAGFLSDWLGRRLFLLFSAILFAIGGLIMALSNHVFLLIIGRSIAGLALGASSSGVPVLIAEFAPTKHRGKLSTLPQFMVSSGILLSYFTAFLMSLDSLPEWRIMVGVSTIPAMIFGCCLCVMPESPRWLLNRGRKEEAMAVCFELGLSVNDIPGLSDEEEDKAIMEGYDHDAHTSQSVASNSFRSNGSGSGDGKKRKEVIVSDSQNHVSYTDKYNKLKFKFFSIFYQSPLLSALLIGGSLQAFQQLCGINAVVCYTPEILRDAGAVHLIPLKENSAAILASIIAYSLKIPCIIFAMHVMDRVGRRKIMLWSIPLMTLSLLSLSCCFGLLPPGSTRTALSVLSVSVYGCSFVVGLGPIPSIVCSEIFPTESRGKWVGMCLGINFACNILVSQTFPALMAWAGGSGVFSFYAAVCVLAYFFVWRFLPETNGMGLEETCKILERLEF